eukprot:TRINITY_DN33094_c0_g1_i1.p1 TRINITY_DN33094_c0_g1~~TRINITY_DN33094_c0_g1_i1.p1  ORF type:complete len:344 (+),score=85.75 TRINITY_DN33094_c0_g1_i1:69-1034(+)
MRLRMGSWRSVLQTLKKKDNDADINLDNMFTGAVVEKYPGIRDGYLAAILNPSDLTDVERKLGRGEYASDQQFSDALNLIWLNCYCFNVPQKPTAPPTIYQKRALEMQETMLSLLEDENLPPPSVRRPADILDKRASLLLSLFSRMETLPNDGKIPRKRGRSETPQPRKTATPPPAADAAERPKKQAKPTAAEKKAASRKQAGGGGGGRKSATASPPPPRPAAPPSPPPLRPGIADLLARDEQWWKEARSESDTVMQTLLLDQCVTSDRAVLEQTAAPEVKRQLQEGLGYYEEKLRRVHHRLVSMKEEMDHKKGSTLEQAA